MLLSTTVVGLHVLSGLPPIMVYGILFGVMVFAIVCGAAFMKADVSTKHHGPPQLQFRAPVRRAKKRKPKAPAL